MKDETTAVLVSGVNGVLGQPLADYFSEKGYQVFRVVRTLPEKPSDTDIHWDLDAGQSPRLPLVDTYIHCAPIWTLPDNIGHLSAAGVRRIVAFSSSSAISKAASRDPGERMLAERLIRSEADTVKRCREGQIHLTVFRPTLIYGFGRDQNICRIARIISRYHVGVLAGAGAGLRQPVHTLDLAWAALAVVDNPGSFDKTYILAGGETLSYREMMTRIIIATGRSPRVISVPVWMLRGLMRAASMFGDFDYTAEMAGRMNTDLNFDYGMAEADFGYSPAGFLEQPMRDLPAETLAGRGN